MARSTQQQIDDCDAAIQSIETGAQAYSARGRSAQKAQLATLYKRLDELQERLLLESNNGGSMASLAIQTRPT